MWTTCSFLAFNLAIYALVTVTLSTSQQLVEGLYIAPEEVNAQGRLVDYQFSRVSKEANTTEICFSQTRTGSLLKRCAVLLQSFVPCIILDVTLNFFQVDPVEQVFLSHLISFRVLIQPWGNSIFNLYSISNTKVHSNI
jgi:hypothetical protein